MNSIMKITVAGGALLVSAALLVSFAKGTDGGKTKKYQIIHHANGETIKHDTIISMNSTYTPQQFLADKGISDKDAKIITIPSISELPDHGKMMHTFVHEIDVEHDGNGEGETVEISVEMDENGDLKTKKMVNGVEVEMTETELKEIKTKHVHHGEMVNVRIDDNDFKEMDERVEIRVEMDDAGKKTVKKTVNGKEVEMTQEDLNDLEIMNGNEIKVFISSDELDEHMKEIELEIEKIMEEGGENLHVITKRIEMNSDDPDFQWESIEGDHEVKIITMGPGGKEMEDHTIVLVTENYDESNPAQAKILRENSSREINVYPNPNDGTFKIRFESDEKLKTNITVSDANGKKVFEENLGKFSGVYEKEIDLKKFGSGMYTITIQNGNDEDVQKVMIK